MSIDDTLCEHVGNSFEYVDHHYDHTDKTFPVAHNLATVHFVSGAVRFPIDYRRYRRYEEFANSETFVNSFTLKGSDGQPIQFEKPKMQLREIVPLIPPSAFKPVEVEGTIYYCFTENLCLPDSSGKRHVSSPKSSIGQAIRQQQKALIEALILHAHRLLQAGKQDSEVFDPLFAKQRYSLAP